MGSYSGSQSAHRTPPAITPAAPSYGARPAWRFVATAHLSIDQVNYWNKYSDTLVRYSRYICVNRRE